ncbi:copper chaperone PCu(A)C [Streptomyces sp. NPDC059454]|uniref:copper chaperone PCu(A)C n=1 Tax=Streptomyces sp. NPDC059454 TaxID=3346836 RepID=UPI0036C0F416
MALPRTPRARHGLAAGALAATLALAGGGCGADDDFSLPDWDAPGQNTRVGDLMIRYAHLAEPTGDPWQPGDDVAAYVWLYNKGGGSDRLVGASSPMAASVDIVDSDGKRLSDGVEVPENDLVELEPGKDHLILRDVRQVIRGGDATEITLRFEDAGSATFGIQAQPPVYDESGAPKQ